jgi:hypothetical protein
MLSGVGDFGNYGVKKKPAQLAFNILDPSGFTAGMLGGIGSSTGSSDVSDVFSAVDAQDDPNDPVIPATPTDETAAAASRAAARRKKKQQSQSQTIYTSPLGVTDQADISRKTLLGQ